MSLIRQPLSISAAMLRRVESQPDEPALWFRHRGEPFARWTWQELSSHVVDFAAALLRAGVMPGDRVAQWSSNRREWIVADLAMHLIGVVHVPIHRPLSAQQAATQVSHSEARLLLVENTGQAEQIAGRIAGDIAVVCFDGERSAVPLLSELLEAIDGEDRSRVADLRSLTPEAARLATILYTSGTTGEPKGVMLGQDHLLFTATQMENMFGSEPGHRRMSLLPLSHIFARTCDLYVWLLGHGEMALVSAREDVFEDCRAYSPHVMNGVPYFFQKVQQRVEAGATLEELLGKDMRYCCCGGAPLALETHDFFAAQELPLLQGYGLTESSPVISACTPQFKRRGSVGRPITNTEVRIRDGEIQTRGPHVMIGYYKNPAATETVIEDGWLKTGDLGHLDDDRYLFVTGRSKEVICLSTGKKVAPTLVESMLVADPWIEQVMVVGENRSCLAALIVVNDEMRASDDLDPRGDDLESRIQQIIDTRLASLGHHERVRRCAILPREFSAEEGELTAKLSLRREVIERRWAETIDALYANEE